MVGTRPTKTRPDTTVGSLLATARERRGITLEQAEQALSIPRKHLQALEEGDLAVFTAEVYARGAFSAYAQWLGVATQKNKRAFQRILTGVREHVPLRVHTPRPWLAAVMSPRFFLALVVGGAGVLVGSYMAWQAYSFVRLPQLTLESPVISQVTDDTVAVIGATARDATLRVNGEQVLTDEQGRFEHAISVHPGITVVRVEATNAAGRTATIQRDILRPRS